MQKYLPFYVLFCLFLLTLFWWVFAFFPLSNNESLEWLARAQTVCFGSLPGGLPSSSGWIMLIAAPLTILVVLLFIWGGEIKALAKSFFLELQGRVILALSLAMLLLMAVWVVPIISAGLKIEKMDFSSPSQESMPEHYPKTNKPAPDFNLVNHRGEAINLSTFLGQRVILTFAFANCKTICSGLIQQGKRALEDFGLERTKFVVITLDPWRDTPKSLPTLATKWKVTDNIHVLSGEVEKVLSALKAFNVPWERDMKNGDIAHPALSYIIDSNGIISYTLNNASPGWLAEAVNRSP